ncbi:MAG TPA: hypothetical protein VHY79_14820 [Rhizomicrobium sp.]|jgi:hypothetical protein|nr:hypothetical protein [Rhizomicrobium sp.]
MTAAIITNNRPRASLAALLFGAAAAPIFWLGQLMLSYLVSALACYGSDHPTTISSDAILRSTLYAFDAVAIAAAIAGGIVALLCWRAVRDHETDSRTTAQTRISRMRFLAMWGMMSSLWFLGAIVFNVIGSATVRLCVQ